MLSTSPTTIYKSLNRLMNYYPDNFNELAKKETESLFKYCLEGIESDSEKFLATLFIKALNNKVGSNSINEHIYLKKYEIPQIQLFSILIEKFPFVKNTQLISNQTIVEIIKQSQEATIIDIGIGQGTQIKNIIELLGNTSALKKLKIIGIEPFTEALLKAQTTITSYRGKVPFEIEFVGINEFAENVNFNSFKCFAGTLVVNASLALHHIQTQLQRSKVIAKIKSINPTAFILTEPNVNHFEPDFYLRFQNCYQHFHSIFKVIDTLDVDTNDKSALKLFFGREIDNIIGKAEEFRYEKHEPASHWIEKLQENDFIVKNNFIQVPVEKESGIEVGFHKEGFLGFTFEKETVVAIICAV